MSDVNTNVDGVHATVFSYGSAAKLANNNLTF